MKDETSSEQSSRSAPCRHKRRRELLAKAWTDDSTYVDAAPARN